MPELPAPRAGRLKDKLKTLLGRLVFPRQSRRWAGAIASDPLLAALAYRNAPAINRVYRPYLSNHLSCAERIDVICSHYHCVQKMRIEPLVVTSLAIPVSVARFIGKEGARMELLLAGVSINPREGELAFQLTLDGVGVFSVSFSFIEEQNERHVVVGAIQGVSAENGSDIMRRASRELYGTRPKNFLINVLRDLGAALGCAHMILVSNLNRVVVNPRRRARITLDYDTTWREQQAHLRADGNFMLACRAAADIDLNLVPSKKRGEARRRQDLLLAIRRQFMARAGLAVA